MQGVRFKSLLMSIVSLLFCVFGIWLVISRKTIITTASTPTGSVTATWISVWHSDQSQKIIPIQTVKNIEYAQFRFGARPYDRVRVVYINTYDGVRIKIAAQQDRQFLSGARITEQEIHEIAQKLAIFLHVPIDDDPNKLRPPET